MSKTDLAWAPLNRAALYYFQDIVLWEGVPSIVIRILFKLSFSNEACNLEFPARMLSKKQAEILDL